MTPEQIRFKLREARFFLDSLKRDLPSMIRQHPEVSEYHLSAFLNAPELVADQPHTGKESIDGHDHGSTRDRPRLRRVK